MKRWIRKLVIKTLNQVSYRTRHKVRLEPGVCGFLTGHAPFSVTIIRALYDLHTCRWCGKETKIPRAGTSFFVDELRGSDDNDGLSFGKAMKSLSVAMAASNANAAEHHKLFPGWVEPREPRNSIFFV